jgi:uncharacterized protein (DUF2235 family)
LRYEDATLCRKFYSVRGQRWNDLIFLVGWRMKRLAIFLDGTWNTLDNNTNVWRLKSLTAETDEQRVYYSQGVGTQRGETARGGVTGYGIDDEIIDAYTWLIQNFDEGDEIFIFGFSRGAYTARSLSGLICKCGVLKLGAPLSIEQLYARYRIYEAATIRSLMAKPLPQSASIEEQWLTKYSRPTKVKCVGVWDTVGSLGLPVASAAGKVHKYRFLDTHLRLDNEYAFHALALDEHRKNFEPTFWTRTDRIGHEGAAERQIDKVEQRWFVGAHANVGGGLRERPAGAAPVDVADGQGRRPGSRLPRSGRDRRLASRAARHGFLPRVRVGSLPLRQPPVLSDRRYRAGARNAGHDVADQRDHRRFGVRALARGRDLSSAKPRRMGQGEGRRSRQIQRRGPGH